VVELDLDVGGRRVLVVGGARSARHTVARYLSAGATVYLAAESAGTVPRGVQEVDFPDNITEWRVLVSAVDLVVAVQLSPAADRMVTKVCRDGRTWLTRGTAGAVSGMGSVALVGGGPGDEGLITIAGKLALQNADIVYYDRLAPHDQLREWVSGAELVDVGKSPGHHAVPQSEIERMLVASATAGKTVVRLKGGDPFVFGRGGEEIIACRAAGVPVTVISGVTSAISVPATSGIPLTHREISHTFTVISGHAPLSDDELAHLVGLGGTIVVLMGVGTLPHLTAGLTRHGMRRDMPIAIIESGFSSRQRTTISSVGEIIPVSGALGVRSPAVVVIGEVVRLSQHDDAAVELLQNAVTLATQK
jgi:uroporphyrin-III C-methyltransferase